MPRWCTLARLNGFSQSVMSMQQSIVLTMIAVDRPGIVQRLSAVLREHGGSWHRSSMSRMAGHFAGILEGHVPEEDLEACVAALQALEGEGVQIVIQSGNLDSISTAGEEYRFELVGNDRPGIMAEITAVLGQRGVNVISLETVVEGASMAGGELFRAYARLLLPETTQAAELARALEDLADDLMVDITFEP